MHVIIIAGIIIDYCRLEKKLLTSKPRLLSCGLVDVGTGSEVSSREPVISRKSLRVDAGVIRVLA